MSKEYKKGTLTVVWKPELCIHSENCVKGLPSVFDNSRKPWINLEPAESEAIVQQIKKCPSGALSYRLENSDSEKGENLSGTSASIKMLKDGPLMVEGAIELTNQDGNILEKKSKFFLCRCGHSANKPFCDGSHKKAGFAG